jgi:putative ABC transport system permease protein
MLRNYLLLALKVLLRRPFFAFASLFAISFTLLVLVVASSVLDHVFGPSGIEPYKDRTLGVYQLFLTGESNIWDGSPGYEFLDRHIRTLPDVERVTLFTEAVRVASYERGSKTELYLKRTDGEYWRIFHFDFLEGGPFSVQDEAAGRPVAIVNASTRERLFGSGSAIGRELVVDGQRFEVVGVVEDVSFLEQDPFSDAWVPISTLRDSGYREGLFGDFQAVVLARDARDLPRIKSEFASRLPEVERPDPEHFDTLTAGLDTRFEALSRDYFWDDNHATHPMRLRALIALAFLLFMLLPSINLINVNMSRILERSAEIGVRKAFGASSASLVAQFLVENAVVTLIGAGVGLVLAVAVLDFLSGHALIPYAEFHVNYRVFAYGVGLALIFSFLSGVFPAWRLSRLDPVEALRARTR